MAGDGDRMAPSTTAVDLDGFRAPTPYGVTMNKAHLVYCSSDEWADAVKRWIIPGALAGVELLGRVLEVGPGPGRTTEVLREMTPELTAVEIDTDLARSLAERLGGAGVRVVQGDGTALP